MNEEERGGRDACGGSGEHLATVGGDERLCEKEKEGRRETKGDSSVVRTLWRRQCLESNDRDQSQSFIRQLTQKIRHDVR